MSMESGNAGQERANAPIDSLMMKGGRPEEDGAHLLLEAFEIFTQASNSLESSYRRLQAKAQRLTEELEAKNLELEKSLREKQEARNYLKTILDHLPCGVFVLDEAGEIALCNPMAAEVLNKSRRKTTGGRPSMTPFLNTGMRRRLAEAARSGENSGLEQEISVVIGKKKKMLSTSGTPLKNEDGCPAGTLHIIRDITEVKALQEKNQRSQRLSAMGEMAVQLAHEIRNPLGSIELFASLLSKETQGDARLWAENIRIGTRSLNTIVSNMLHFANPISPIFNEVDLHEVLHEIGKFCDPIMSQRQVTLSMDLKAANSALWADRELLKQMTLNLIFNAMKAMPSEGLLSIRTRNTPNGPDGGSVGGIELQVEDSGVGIPAENMRHIFDPFFTTNKTGTGLGLSIVHQIIKRHSGSVHVASREHHGTTFTISFSLLPQKDRS